MKVLRGFGACELLHAGGGFAVGSKLGGAGFLGCDGADGGGIGLREASGGDDCLAADDIFLDAVMLAGIELTFEAIDPSKDKG